MVLYLQTVRLQLKTNNNSILSTMETPIKFTEKEWEVIKHRLEVPDALYEAIFMDSNDPVYKRVIREDVENICEYLLSTNGNIPNLGTYLESEVLKDAIEGSTFFPSMSWADELGERGDEEKLRRKWNGVANSIEKKTGLNLPK